MNISAPKLVVYLELAYLSIIIDRFELTLELRSVCLSSLLLISFLCLTQQVMIISSKITHKIQPRTATTINLGTLLSSVFTFSASRRDLCSSFENSDWPWTFRAMTLNTYSAFVSSLIVW